MSKADFHVSLMPNEALELVRDNQNADLVHFEYNDLGEDKAIGTLIFEKYYFRSSNRAALIVIIDNIKGPTHVRVISTGTSQGLIFNIDWGAGNDFVASVEQTLEDYRMD